MKKVSLTLTQVNYLIEEGFNKGAIEMATYGSSLAPEEYDAHQREFLKQTIDRLWKEFKFDLAPDQQPYFNAFAKCICILADWRANKVSLQPAEDDEIAKLIGQFEEVHDEYKYQASKEPVKSLEDQLQSILNAASLKLVEFLKVHNDEFDLYKLEDVFAEDGGLIDEDFLEETVEFIGDTQWDTNETLYFLGIKKSKHTIYVKAVTEFGTDVLIDAAEMDAYTVCKIADFLSNLS